MGGLRQIDLFKLERILGLEREKREKREREGEREREREGGERGERENRLTV